jgi:hypothetical protein
MHYITKYDGAGKRKIQDLRLKTPSSKGAGFKALNPAMSCQLKGARWSITATVLSSSERCCIGGAIGDTVNITTVLHVIE